MVLLAEGCHWLAVVIRALAEAGGIPPEEMQKAGEKAIVLARQALEIRTQLYGTERVDVANDMGGLADALDFFNDVDDDEVLRLHEQANSITSRLEGSSSVNLAVGNRNIGNAYRSRAQRAVDSDDVDRCITNLELALPHFREAIRIYRVNNFMDSADDLLRHAMALEEQIRDIGSAAKRG